MEKQRESRGLGEGSQISFDLDKLRSLGWEVKRRESASSSSTVAKVHLKYKSPDGKTFKSAKDVEKHLRDSRQFSQVAVSVPETDEEPGTRKNKEPRKADEDPDFQPPAAKSAKTACGKG